MGGEPRRGLYSQVRDARRLHLGERGPVGAEGGRAVDQRAVLRQALHSGDVQPQLRRGAGRSRPSTPHPPSAGARGRPHTRTWDQAGPRPRPRGDQAFWGRARARPGPCLFLTGTHRVHGARSLGPPGSALCCSTSELLKRPPNCHCPPEPACAPHCSPGRVRQGWQATAPHCSSKPRGVLAQETWLPPPPPGTLGASRPGASPPPGSLPPQDLLCFPGATSANVPLLQTILFYNCPFMSP